MVQNWVRIPISIFLDKMLEGLSSDNLTKVIMEALIIGGGLPKYQIAQKLICFGCHAPKFLVDPLEGPSMRQCGSGWNLGHDPDFQH